MPLGFQLAQQQATDYEACTRVFMEGSARLLADGASISAGDAVLDLACGTGLVARLAAALVSPGGRTVGADINPAMLAVARSQTERGVEWVERRRRSTARRRVLRPGVVVIATVWATPGMTRRRCTVAARRLDP